MYFEHRYKDFNFDLNLQGSPICVNVTPLQVELLEKDLQDIKVSLQEAKTHNQYLSNIIEQQKKLVLYENILHKRRDSKLTFLSFIL